MSERCGNGYSEPALERARRAAAAFIEARDELGDDASVEAPTLVAGRGRAFGRDPGRAARSVDAVMGQVASLRGGAAARQATVRRAYGAPRLRLASLAAAALAVAVVSSVMTLALTRPVVSVRFVLAAPEARSVSLVADFNDWATSGYELSPVPGGEWEIVVPLRKGKSYIYNFVVDGERWIVDPAAPVRLDDGFGGGSSALTL